jgi:predicted aspartyl protease
MAITIGSTGKSGSPVIKFDIAGAFPNSAREFEATVDTGFTGFISMPIMSALPLGLPLYGTTSVQFGDGKTATRFTALAGASLGGVTEAGVVILEPSTTDLLVGMEFLKSFKKSVLMYRGILFLIDESELDQFIKAAVDAAQKAAGATAADPNTPPPVA